jgi:hypothetical protein
METNCLDYRDRWPGEMPSIAHLEAFHYVLMGRIVRGSLRLSKQLIADCFAYHLSLKVRPLDHKISASHGNDVTREEYLEAARGNFERVCVAAPV